MSDNSRSSRIVPILWALLVLTLAGCASVTASIEKGDFATAEKLAAASKGAERAASYRALADSALKRKDWASAFRYLQAAGDPEGLLALAKRLKKGMEDYDIRNEAIIPASEACLTSYYEAAKMEVARGRGDYARKEIAPEGLLFAVNCGPRGSAAAEQIAAAAGMPESQYCEAIADRLYAIYTKSSSQWNVYLVPALSYYERSGKVDKIARARRSLAEELVWAKRPEEALPLLKQLGLDERASASLVGELLLKPDGIEKYDSIGSALALTWFDRAGDAEGRARAYLSLGEAHARSGQLEQAEKAFRASGRPEKDWAKTLADLYSRKRQDELAASWYEKAGLPERAQGIYYLLGEERLGKGDFPAAAALLEKAGDRNPGTARYCEKIGEWYQGRGEYDKALAFMARSGKPNLAASAYQKAVAAALAKGEVERALELGKASKDDSLYESAYQGKARLLIEAGKTKEAYESLAALLGPGPKAARACLAAAAEAGLWKELKPILALAGKDGLDASQSLAEKYAYLKPIASVRLSMAAGEAETAAKTASLAFDAAFNRNRFDEMAELNLALGKSPAEAYIYAAERLSHEPDTALALFAKAGLGTQEAFLRLAKVYEAERLAENAAIYYEKAGKKDRARALRLGVVDDHLSNGHWSEAESLMKEAGLDPAEARRLMGAAARKRGDWKKLFDLGVEGGATEKAAAKAVADAALKASSFDAAVEFYDRAGEEAKARPLLVSAAEEAIRRGVPGRASKLYARAGDAAKAAWADRLAQFAGDFWFCVENPATKDADLEALVAKYRESLDSKELLECSSAAIQLLALESNAILEETVNKGLKPDLFSERKLASYRAGIAWLEALNKQVSKK